MTPEDRKVMEQALEALEDADQIFLLTLSFPSKEPQPGSVGAKIKEAISALRARLAEPAQEARKDEAIYAYEWDTYNGGIHRSFSPDPYNGCPPDRLLTLYASPPARQELSEEEDARCSEWLWSNGSRIHFGQFLDEERLRASWDAWIERKVRG